MTHAQQVVRSFNGSPIVDSRYGKYFDVFGNINGIPAAVVRVSPWLLLVAVVQCHVHTQQVLVKHRRESPYFVKERYVNGLALLFRTTPITTGIKAA